jgi:hypothetical protein
MHSLYFSVYTCTEYADGTTEMRTRALLLLLLLHVLLLIGRRESLPTLGYVDHAAHPPQLLQQRLQH